SEVVFRLEKPRWLTGKVVDAETGQPIPGVHVLAANLKGMTGHGAARGVSQRDGRFTIPVNSGEWRFSMVHNVDGYFVPSATTVQGVATKPAIPLVKISPDKVPEGVTISLARGLEVSGQVVDSAGRPQAGVTVQAEILAAPYIH